MCQELELPPTLSNFIVLEHGYYYNNNLLKRAKTHRISLNTLLNIMK